MTKTIFNQNQHKFINSNFINIMANKGLIKSIRINKHYIELRSNYSNVYNTLKFLKLYFLTKMDILVDIAVYNCFFKQKIDKKKIKENDSVDTVSNNTHKDSSININHKYSFSVIYNLLSLVFNRRLMVYSELDKNKTLNSIVDLYKNSN